jgi:hypothetical protein
MAPLTALSFVFAGCSLVARRAEQHRAATWLAMALLVVGAAVLTSHLALGGDALNPAPEHWLAPPNGGLTGQTSTTPSGLRLCCRMGDRSGRSPNLGRLSLEVGDLLFQLGDTTCHHLGIAVRLAPLGFSVAFAASSTRLALSRPPDTVWSTVRFVIVRE